jgi:hypothetical protein
MADDNLETAQIERNLAQTRARMDNRLGELQDRLSPNQLVNDALSHFGGENGADFTQTLIAKAKANPLPAALVGVGLIWLMASSQRKQDRRPSAHVDLPARLRSAEAGVVRLEDEHPDIHASRLDDARGQVLGVARQATDTASSYSQRIKDAVASAAQSARETAHDLQSGILHTVGHLGDQARQGSDAFGAGGAASSRSLGGALASVTGNPIMFGTAAALVGLVAGVLIPVSDEEQQALGNMADQLRSKGRGLAQDIVDRGAQVAGDALGAAKDSAQAHGLTADRPVGELLGEIKSGDLVGHVKQAAQEVAAAGKESLQRPTADRPEEQR